MFIYKTYYLLETLYLIKFILKVIFILNRSTIVYYFKPNVYVIKYFTWSSNINLQVKITNFKLSLCQQKCEIQIHILQCQIIIIKKSLYVIETRYLLLHCCQLFLYTVAMYISIYNPSTQKKHPNTVKITILFHHFITLLHLNYIQQKIISIIQIINSNYLINQKVASKSLPTAFLPGRRLGRGRRGGRLLRTDSKLHKK